MPNSTLLQVPELLANEKYRDKVVDRLADPVLKNFWINEFGKMSPQMKSEVISPILNKVGQLLSVDILKNIFASHENKLDFRKIMDEKKILIIKLPK